MGRPTDLTPWRNRIVGNGPHDPRALKKHSRNWRKHPVIQREALTDVLDQIGWVGEVLVNTRTGNLIDGHLRVDLAIERGEEEIPVTWVDLSEEEEISILATFDPIAMMAETNAKALRELLEDIKESQDVGAIDKAIATAGVYDEIDYKAEWEAADMPEFDNPPIAERIIKVAFKTANDIGKFEETIGQKLPEKKAFIWFP